jgi:hypothetical protein
MAIEEHLEKKKSVAAWKVVVGSLLGFVLVTSAGLIVRELLNEPQIADQKVIEARLEKLQKLRQEDHETTTTYSWADKPAGVVRIPINQAVALTVKELQAKTVQRSAVPVVPVIPVVAPPAAPAAGVKK